MVAPGTALREGIDNIVHAQHRRPDRDRRPDELASSSPAASSSTSTTRPALLYQVAKMDGAIVAERERDEDRDGQRPADAGPDDPLARDRHAPPHRRARLQADRRARDRHLAAARGRLALRRRREVHPRGHPRRARQGQPGARDARQVPHAPRPGLHAPHRARVRGRRDAARRAHRAPALRARHAHGRRDRALHRRARHRGPPDRDAARGDDGRHRRRQGRARARLPRARTPTRRSPPALDQLGRLPHQDLLDFGRLAELLGYDRKLNTLDYPVSPRGYRILGRIPRLPKLVVAQIVEEFGGLDELLAATDAELETVEGVGEIRAKDIREGLRRLQEINLVDRYLQT